MINPRTDREQLFAEVCLLQGLEQGLILGHQQLISVIRDLKLKGIKALEEIEERQKEK